MEHTAFFCSSPLAFAWTLASRHISALVSALFTNWGAGARVTSSGQLVFKGCPKLFTSGWSSRSVNVLYLLDFCRCNHDLPTAEVTLRPMVGWKARYNKRPYPFQIDSSFQQFNGMTEEHHDKHEIRSVDSREGLGCDISGCDTSSFVGDCVRLGEDSASNFGM